MNDITNGEAAELEILALFLKWMRAEGLALPETSEQAERILFRWLKACRRAALERLAEEGRSTGRRLTGCCGEFDDLSQAALP